MSIIRAQHAVIIVQRSLIEDDRLSWGARGLMAFIDARPECWEFNIEELLALTGDSVYPFITSQDIIDGLVDELLAAGYLVEDGSA